MAWNDSITQFTIGTSNHADNFNEVHNKLLENDKELLSKVSLKADKNYVDSQDANLTQQINVLYTNGFNGEYRHYDGDLTDLNDFTTLGKFEIVKDLSTIKNLPVNASGLVRFNIVLEKRISNVYRQEIHFKSTPFFNRAFYRDTLDNGDWGEWAEVATTTKTDILCVPSVNCSIGKKGLFTINNQHYISFNLYKVGGGFTLNTDDPICTVSIDVGDKKIPLSSQTRLGDTIISPCNVYIKGNTIYVNVKELADQVDINGVIVL